MNNRYNLFHSSPGAISKLLLIAGRLGPKDGSRKNPTARRGALRIRRNAAAEPGNTRSPRSSVVLERNFSAAGRYCFRSNYKYGSPGQNCILHTPSIARSIIVSTILRSPSRQQTERRREVENFRAIAPASILLAFCGRGDRPIPIHLRDLKHATSGSD